MMREAPQSRAPRIDIIDGLRGYAILAVIFHHIYIGSLRATDYMSITLLGWKFTPFTLMTNAWQAVTLFFIISGFVLALPYATGTRSLHHFGDWLHFVSRRIRRLLPLLLFNTLFLLTFLRIDPLPRDTVKNLFFMTTFLFPFTSSLHIPPFNAPLWYLGIEFWLSLLLPLFIICARRWEWKVPIFTAIILCFTSYVTFHRAWLWDLTAPFWGIGHLMMNLKDILIGAALAYAYVQRPRGRSGSLWIVSGILFLAYSFFLTDSVLLHLLPKQTILITNLLTTIGFGLLLFGLLTSPPRVIRMLVANWPLQLIGMMSYSLYVWHLPPMGILHASATPVRLVRYLFLVFVTSFLSYRFIEFGSVKDWRSLLPYRRRNTDLEQFKTESW
ncbi:MAG: acyltransferase [Candidatus Peribacteraceae bacterium]|nr:acyltransferase [Candidatus Peribacteraceae bacterium]